MADHSWAAFVLVVFATVAVISSGGSVSVFHDSENVTATVTVDGDPGTNQSLRSIETFAGSGTNVSLPAQATNVSDRGLSQNQTDGGLSQNETGTETCPSGDSNGTASGTEDGITVSLDPASRTVGAGNETTYRLLVSGADENITKYELDLVVCDPSVATFQTFTHRHEGTHNDRVTAQRIELNSGVQALRGLSGDEITFGTVTVAGNASGETRIGVADADEVMIFDYPDDGEGYGTYNVSATRDGTITVD